MIHVCHISDTSLEGDYFRNISAGLTRLGVRVSLIELGVGTPPTWLSEIEGVSYRSLEASSKIGYLLAARRLARILKDEEIDILQTHLYFSGLVGVLTKRFQRTTTIALMRHHTAVVRMLGSRFHVAADKWMAEKADRVMTVSEAARRYMIDVDGIRRDDIAVVYLGFDFAKMSPNAEKRAAARAEFGFSEEDIVIGYVGNFVTGKGHVQLINAFDAIKREAPNAKLILAGRGKLIEVEDTVGRLGLGRRITFAGWRDDISSVYNAMDIFVQPSLSEAFSQVLIEAMGCGLPVVATNVGGASEVIDDGVNGISVQPDDTGAIAESVIRLIDHEDIRRSMAERGIESVRERFSAQRMVERHLELYRDFVEQA